VYAMNEILEGYGVEAEFTLLDRFDGYYATRDRDLITGVRIDRAVVEANLARSRGWTRGAFQLETGDSTNPTSFDLPSSHDYDVVILDGDHSSSGVASDLITFGARVRQGGFLVVDDYGNPQWPGVKAGTDSVLTDDSALRRVWEGANSLVSRNLA
jgi:nitrite reductase/ring-hydroxylating ferredoxin subunit